MGMDARKKFTGVIKMIKGEVISKDKNDYGLTHSKSISSKNAFNLEFLSVYVRFLRDVENNV